MTESKRIELPIPDVIMRMVIAKNNDDIDKYKQQLSIGRCCTGIDLGNGKDMTCYTYGTI